MNKVAKLIAAAAVGAAVHVVTSELVSALIEKIKGTDKKDKKEDK